ncbi:MAG: AtpZ/AtpI family protein [Desulfobulbaceae bacterium]|jgi:F0F1-type ATP synthase assembly protein I|nr:AtpZ/AtpI family protein [Desulfobulbaceae bacterium]
MANVKKEVVRQLAHFGQLGLTFAVCIFIGFGAGYFVDQRIFSGRLAPLFMFIGLSFGIAAGYRVLFDVLQRSNGAPKDDRS